MASKTYANLSTVTTTDDSDLVAVYPTGGPLKVIAWVNLVAQLVTDLAASFLRPSQNLADLNSAGVARVNLGLGSSATVDTGTTSGTIALLGTGGKTPISTLPGGYLTKSSTYSAVLADNGKLIDCTGTFTLTLPSAATVGETYSIDVRNKGSGVITVSPPSGTIDGASSVTIGSGATRTIVNDGTNYYTTPEGPVGWTLLDTQTFSSGTSKTFSDINQTYEEIMLVFDGVDGSAATFDISVTLSADDVTYTSAWIAYTGTGPARGAIRIPFYTNPISSADGAVGTLSSTNTYVNGVTGNGIAYYLSGALKYVKLTYVGTGAFNAGTVRLYAR